jgi:FkbM family methyltransferase
MIHSIKKNLENNIVYLLTLININLAKKFLFRKELSVKNKRTSRTEIEILLLPFFLKDNFYFIDVGANRGLYCFFAEKFIPEECIIAFEPIPYLAKSLRRLFPLCQVEQKALSSSRETTILFIPLNYKRLTVDTRSTLELNSEDLKLGFEKIAIETTTLDDLLLNQKNIRVSLIKIDVEGHETKVILGAINLLKTQKPFLIIEIESRHHKGDVREVFDLLISLNYGIFYLDKAKLQLRSTFETMLSNMTYPSNLHVNNNFVCAPIENLSIIDSINAQLTHIHK